jgi:hypothetical protein
MVEAGEVEAVLGVTSGRVDSEEFETFLSEVEGAVAEIATRVTPEQRLVDAILRYEGEGYRTYRLEIALRHPPSEREVEELVERYAADVARLSAIAAEIRSLDVDAPELARADLLRNPDRVLEAETLVEQVQERLRPLPEPEPGPDLDGVTLPADSPALNAARAVARRPGARPVPLFVRGKAGCGKTALLEALARQARHEMPMLPIAVLRGPQFAAEFEVALHNNRVDALRARYHRARLLIIDDFDRLDASEGVRDELYRLFDGIRRSGGQVVLAGERDPGMLDGVRDPLAMLLAESDVAEVVAEDDASGAAARGTAEAAQLRDTFFLDREKALPRWPYVEDWLVMELE